MGWRPGKLGRDRSAIAAFPKSGPGPSSDRRSQPAIEIAEGVEGHVRQPLQAVEQVCAAGILSPDLGGTATTKEVTNAVVEAVRGVNR